MRILVRPVGQLHDVVTIGTDRSGARGIDDDRAIHAHLFLHTGVAVVPVGTGLRYFEPVGERFAGPDTGKTDARHAVHLVRQDDPVPVNRGVHGQPIADADGHGLAFAPAQRRAGKRTIDGGGQARLAGEVDRRFGDGEIELGAGQQRRRAQPGRRALTRLDRIHPGRRTEQHTARGQALDEPPA